MRFFVFVGWFVVSVFVLCFTGIALSYFSFDLQHHFLQAKQEFISDAVWLTAFYMHLFFGTLAILTGLLLFMPKIIAYRSGLHRKLGRLYILSILVFSAPTGLYLAFFAEGGPWGTLGYILMTTVWALPTYIAFVKIIRGDVAGHYNWMIRSYCIGLSGITLRLLTPVGSHYMGFDYETNFILSAYVPWILHVFLAEALVYMNRNKVKQFKFKL